MRMPFRKRLFCLSLVVLFVWFVLTFNEIFHVRVGTGSEWNSKLRKQFEETIETKEPPMDMVNDEKYPIVDFKLLFPEVMPEIRTKDIFLIVLVNSGAKGDEFRKRRDKIRQTWGSDKSCEQLRASSDPKLKSLKWLLVFVIAKADPGTDDDERNVQEAKQHNDMLVGDIDDNYINNIIKFYMGHMWASMLEPKYTLKTDDDVYVRIPKVVEYLVNENFPRPFYGGETYDRTIVDHRVGGKWSISKKYFDERLYPPFNAGAFFILSTDLISKLSHYVHHRKPFHTDDAYVGVAMRDLKVQVTHILSFDIKNDMATLILAKNNCQILALTAFGHSMEPETLELLHGRLESMCRKTISSINC